MASFAFICTQPANAQGYDPNQGQYAQQQGGYQQPPVYQQYNGIPQTSPNSGYSGGQPMQQQQYGGQPQYAQQPADQQQYGQPQLQQQYAQYGQMPQPQTFYGNAQQQVPGGYQQNGGAQQADNSAPQMPAGSFLNDSPGENSSTPPEKSITENPSGGVKGGAAIKAAGGMLGKFVGGVGRMATPAASMYLMNRAVGGNMRVVMPAPMIPIPGMGGGYGGFGGGYGNPYMGNGMRNMMGGW
ncbi:MAG: hypothetical protein SGJ27_15705 [Candidatus Melainabacteria bacterium]|nr:hypothetical protein [Candidatus Melainabacteria bacterium]